MPVIDKIRVDGTLYDIQDTALTERVTQLEENEAISLEENSNLNSLINPGIYYGSSDVTITNRPTNDDFYVLHLHSSAGFAQLAITPTGLKSRLNNGIWV